MRKYLAQNGESKTSNIVEYIGLSPARELLNDMEDVVPVGGNSNRTYKLN